MQPFSLEAAREAAQRDVLAADLQCSFFASALQSYKRDSVLRPFPASYVSQDNKDFEALLEDASMLPNLKELLQSADDKDNRAWNLVSWILSSKVLTLRSIGKTEYVKIQELMGISGTSVPAPDFLFEIVYSGRVDAKFHETKGERDLIYAFHGSRLENFHSILHNGLHCHLNKRKMCPTTVSPLDFDSIGPHGMGWQHSLLGPILSCVALCEIIDHPDVKCQTKKKDSEEIDRKRARAKHSEGGDVPPKYFVVTNNQLLRVKYLLVYSQKQHKRVSSQPSWISNHRFTLAMLLYLLLLIIIGVSNSPSFLHYWNRALESKR
ncbi:protein mono-ADP-ribosyltransferase PARP16 isoform X2 [Trichosurus vulpecula]|uniref:protein mono-ADP-ribosyltransferase PARP16 isoform X2 n=1 Tax=Trichosurus vulpecula TaxID=9337 RepID=UPI00186AEF7B|nr:protein mono-ADP-ribosyltransferase PARP16 isoform X2 [Trichosurus vulpecula]